ncbi:MAG: hypothetical protein HDT43_02355 [Ruminococcaceae bacterium]|nr:hypothetical protein [Oscillospiraceae bacterium]
MNFNNEAMIKKDRLRYTKNKLSSNLTLLAILINAFYFVSIYKSDVGSYYYTYIIGISVIYNLLFMLIAFLSSEGVKTYKVGYSFALIAIGIGQIIRIFIIPMNANQTVLSLGGEETAVMGGLQFVYVCVCLVASAALCVIAGVINIIKARTLAEHQAEIDKIAKGS